jgi:penicillin-binding protein 1A
VTRGRLVSLLGWVAIVLGTSGAGAVGGVLAAYVQDLPSLDLLERYEPSLATTLYSDRDEPFAALYEQRRILVPLHRIPRGLRQAVLAMEDVRFYDHRGLDPRRIVGALLADLRALRRVQGGSTITQQLARSLFLTPDKKFSRKVKEALLAIALEKRYSKARILELYLNQIYFGHGAYGVEAAAQTYFRKSVEQLTLGEAALIAGLTSAPNAYSPLVDPERARRRRDLVLARMLRQGFVNQPDVAEAARTVIQDAGAARPRSLAPYFVEQVRQALEEKYGAYLLYHGGLRVYTTLNLDIQRAAEQALAAGLREIDAARGWRGVRVPPPPKGTAPRLQIGAVAVGTVVRVRPNGLTVAVGSYRGEIARERLAWTKADPLSAAFVDGQLVKLRVLALDEGQRLAEVALEQDPEIEGAFLALDPRDGQIKAMLGGYDFDRSKFNRAVQARRQPGSAFKPFIYAAAFDGGLTPSSLFDDTPISFPILLDGRRTEWSPQNSDRRFRGPLTLRRALEQSVNVVAVRLLKRVGVQPVISLARQAGIDSALRPELALALGVSEVSLLELVSAYGTFANRGIRVEPFAIRRVTDHRGQVLEEHVAEGRPVLREETAFVLTHVLKGVVERGTARRAAALGRPIAGKTGTTDEASDVWFVGYTPSLAAGVWLGYDAPRSLGPHESSAHLAVPIWVNVFRQIADRLPVEDFAPPAGVIGIPVDHATGRPARPDDRQAILEFFIRGTEPEGRAAGGASQAGPPPSTGRGTGERG